MFQKECDVLVIGAGMGGNCLVRQLNLAMPDLKIINIEKKKEFDYWIGESTVEPWVDYAYRHCNLGAYLHKHQMLKNGLRFYFDSEKKDLSMHEMSETGRTAYPGSPKEILSHQLDRATFDRDICEMNKKNGVDVMLGTYVTLDKDGKPAITLDRNNGHVVVTNAGTIRCKWLVDAGGRSAPLAQKLGLVQKEPSHPVGSYWGRFKGFKNIDEMGPTEWKKRVNHTLRYLSTNHFMYKGYWIWMIPLSDDLVSIGVSFHREMTPLKMKNGDELLTFLRQHRCFREILPEETTSVVDFMGFSDCARHAKQFYSEDRWFLTGMSGFVIDAFFSTTGITTSFSNRLIGEMIKNDRAGEKKLFEKQVSHFNIFMETMYQTFLLTMKRYREFACFEAWAGWRPASLWNYYNTMVPNSTEDFQTLFETVKSHSDNCGCSIEKALKEFEASYLVTLSRLNKELVDYLEANGKYYGENKGGFLDTVPRASIVDKFFERRDSEKEYWETVLTYETVFRYFLSRIATHERVDWNETAFKNFFKRDWQSGQTLAMGLKALADAPKENKVTTEPNYTWTPRGPVNKRGQEIPPIDFYADEIEKQYKKTG